MVTADQLMTPQEVIEYLKLEAESGDPRERLRNLVRRQGLPRAGRGRLQRFRRSAIDQWLDSKKR